MLLKQFLFKTVKAVAPERARRFYVSVKNVKQDRCYYCPVCKARLSHFNPTPVEYLKKLDRHGYVHSLFTAETFNLFDYECPSCSATDRDRLYALYLRQKLATMDGTKKYTFRDFGPNAALSEAIRSYPFLNYRSADLFKDNVDDQVFSPTYTRDLARKITHLMTTDYYGIFHITNKGACSWYEFTVKILKLASMKTPVVPITSDQYPQKARRPRYSVLDNYQLRLLGMDDMRAWQKALEDYLVARGHIA
jgi:hypothetical protein